MNTLYESPPKQREVCLHRVQTNPSFLGSAVAPPSRRESPRTTPEIPLATHAISLAFVTTPGDLFPQSPLSCEEVSHATHAVTEFHNDIVNSFEKKQKIIATFFYLSKVFDTIDHHVLLIKLENDGVRGMPLNWFKSYLSDRTQYVMYNDHISKRPILTVVLPQGSILGLLLFIIYTNDLPYCCNGGWI